MLVFLQNEIRRISDPPECRTIPKPILVGNDAI